MNLSINTGFLTGNLWGAADPIEEGIDEQASIDRFIEILTSAILKKYPSADISIDYQHASGAIPASLATSVYGSDNPIDDAEIAEDIDRIQETIFTAGKWYVNAE